MTVSTWSGDSSARGVPLWTFLPLLELGDASREAFCAQLDELSQQRAHGEQQLRGKPLHGGRRSLPDIAAHVGPRRVGHACFMPSPEMLRNGGGLDGYETRRIPAEMCRLVAVGYRPGAAMMCDSFLRSREAGFSMTKYVIVAIAIDTMKAVAVSTNLL
jgi:hypothetical protein